MASNLGNETLAGAQVRKCYEINKWAAGTRDRLTWAEMRQEKDMGVNNLIMGILRSEE